MLDLLAAYYGQRRVILPTEGLVFYASLDGRTPSQAESGQALATTGTITYGRLRGVPCAAEWSATAAITFSDAGLPSGGAARTMSMWICGRAMMGYGRNATRALAYLFSGASTAVNFNTSGANTAFTGLALPADRLAHICVTVSGRLVALYVGGRYVATNTLANTPNTTLSQGVIGRYASGSDYYHGYTAACRIYNRALSAREIATLAREFEWAQ